MVTVTGAIAKSDAPSARDGKRDRAGRTPRRWWRWVVVGLAVVAVLGVAARAALPSVIRWYVNGVLDRSQVYQGRVGEIDVYLYRGAYSIHDVRISKTTGNVPVPLFAAEWVDLAIEWPALWQGKVVGRVEMVRPVVNFVDAPEASGEAGDQTGAGGPWLEIIRDLFPFRINSVVVRDGEVHFRVFQGEQPVDVYLSRLQGRIENLTNIRDEVTPLVTTVEAEALAMDQARLEYEMRLDPFSHRPTFHMAARLLGLDVTRLNDLTRAYGAFDFENGWLDLVVEVDAKEGMIEGYVKPLFRNLDVLSLRYDVREDHVLALFWEALVGGVQELLQNQPRDQFGTLIPFSGDATGPDADVLTTVANILRNAFIRAYLPRLQEGEQTVPDGLEFGPASPIEAG